MVFLSDTAGGKLFDPALPLSILIRAPAVILNSVTSYHENYGTIFFTTERVFTILFTAEDIIRLFCTKCGKSGHFKDSGYCRFCGASLKTLGHLV